MHQAFSSFLMELYKEFIKIPVSLGHKPAGELQLSHMAVLFMHPHHNQNRKIVIF